MLPFSFKETVTPVHFIRSRQGDSVRWSALWYGCCVFSRRVHPSRGVRRFDKEAAAKRSGEEYTFVKKHGSCRSASVCKREKRKENTQQQEGKKRETTATRNLGLRGSRYDATDSSIHTSAAAHRSTLPLDRHRVAFLGSPSNGRETHREK